MRPVIAIFAVLLILAACAPAPPIEQSRSQLWQKYAHHSIDDVLLAWGTPAAETKLTNGSRLVTYRRATVYDTASPYEYGNGCEVSLLAPSPHFTIENIAMRGNGFECSNLATQGPGYVSHPYVSPPPPPMFFGGYYR